MHVGRLAYEKKKKRFVSTNQPTHIHPHIHIFTCPHYLSQHQASMHLQGAVLAEDLKNALNLLYAQLAEEQVLAEQCVWFL